MSDQTRILTRDDIERIRDYPQALAPTSTEAAVIRDLATTALDALRKRDEAYAHDERMTEKATWNMEQHRIQWERCRALTDALREVLAHMECPCRSTGCVVDRARALLAEGSKDALSTNRHSAPRVGLSDEETLAVQQWLTAPFDVRDHLRQEHGWTDDTFRADDCRNLIELTAHHRRIHASEAYLGRPVPAEGRR